MSKHVVAICACIFLGGFVGGWAAGTAQSHYQFDAAKWRALTDFEKVIFVHGFHQGYSSAADVKEILARKDLSPSARVFAERVDRELTGGGRHVTMGQLATEMSTFYADFRNEPVCWTAALTFSINALNGTPVTEQELNGVREGSAKSGCD